MFGDQPDFGCHPIIDWTVPGDWAEVRMTDEGRVGTLVRILLNRAPRLSEALRIFVACGGEMCFLEARTPTPQLIAIAWPSHGEPGLDALAARVAEATHVDQQILPRSDGYAAVKVEHQYLPVGVWGAEYWVSHPDSGRDLLIAAHAVGIPPSAEREQAFDDFARQVVWSEDVLFVEQVVAQEPVVAQERPASDKPLAVEPFDWDDDEAIWNELDELEG